MTSLGSSDDLPAGATVRDVGGTSVIVWRDGDSVCAVRDHCPHLGLPLSKGPGGLHVEDGTITCPWHGSRFDLRSGENLDWVVGLAGRQVPGWSRRLIALGRTPSPLTTYPVRQEGDDLLIDL